MRDIPTMVDGVTTLPAEIFNEIPDEMENAITSSGQTLTPQDGSNPNLTQLAKAMAIYGSAGSFYSDSGTANAYVLSTIGSRDTSHEYVDGQVVTFIANNANTGNSTVNVASLGVKEIRRLDDTQLASGELSGFVEMFYRASTDRFVLVRSSKIDVYIPNLISDNSKITPSTGGTLPVPDATPRNYTVGYQISPKWFVLTELVDLTYVDGKYNADSGQLYRDIPLEDGIEFYTAGEFIGSTADKDRLPETDGVSLNTVSSPGNLRIIIDFSSASDVFSAKVEIGATPTLHNVGNIGAGGAGAVGGGADQIFFESDSTMTTDYTITTGKNAVVPGDLTINDGVTLTIPDGSRVVIV